MTAKVPDRVAIVTGAGRGIGRAVAVALARERFSLCLAARTREELERTRTMTGLAPERALIVLIDLAEEEAPEAVFDATVERYGRIDVLVNNAGWAPPRTPLSKISTADIDRMIAVNLRAPMTLVKLAASSMSAHGGTIVNIASAAARETPAGEAVYAATKAGLVAFTRAAFSELRQRGIKVSVIVPGLVDTFLIPENKRLDRRLMLAPEDVAAAVVQIINTPMRACPIELALEPQLDPARPTKP